MNEGYNEEEYRDYYDIQDDVIDLLRDYFDTSNKTNLQEIRELFHEVEYFFDFVEDILKILDNKTISNEQWQHLHELITEFSKMEHSDSDADYRVNIKLSSFDDVQIANMNFSVKHKEYNFENQYTVRIKD